MSEVEVALHAYIVCVLINCVYFDIFVYFGSATQKLCHICRLFFLVFLQTVVIYAS